MENDWRTEGPLREQPDEELVLKAQAGDRDAYNELFIRHRDQALGYARRLSNDPHMAEDIVQEALIKAFLHLGSLSHSGFIPWLQTIVRNQALMRLRRGGPFARERPFSGLAVTGDDRANVDFSNVDNVLDYVGKRLGAARSQEEEPQGILLRKEMWESVRGLVRVLSKRERSVFEAFFFGQLSPEEIARLFDLNSANVYKIISRSRQKVVQEHYEFNLRDILRHKLEQAGRRKCELAKPSIEGSDYPHPDLTFMNAFSYCLPYCGLTMTKHELAGWSHYAFKISVWDKRIGPLSMHDWSTYKTNALINLGFHSRIMDIYNFGVEATSNKGELAWKAVRMIRDSVDGGVPALVYDALRPEFALVYGYDDEKQRFLAADTRGHGDLPYSLIGHRRTNSIFIAAIDGRFDLSPCARLLRLLQLIVRHARGKEPIFYSQVNGIRAYDAWVEGLRSHTADPLGHASNVNILADARESAVFFLAELGRQWNGCSMDEENLKVRKKIAEAAHCYEEVSGLFGQLRDRFPLTGAAELDEAGRAFAIRLLNEAKQAEERGVAIIEALLAELSGGDCPQTVPAVVEPSPFFLF